jgi:hypothetical protein
MINYFDNYEEVPKSTFDLDAKIHGSNRRKVPRTPCLIPAHYNINQRLTDRAFAVGAKIFLQYIDPYSKKSTLRDGLVVWSNDAVIGVKFNYHPFTPI